MALLHFKYQFRAKFYANSFRTRKTFGTSPHSRRFGPSAAQAKPASDLGSLKVGLNGILPGPILIGNRGILQAPATHLSYHRQRQQHQSLLLSQLQQ